MATTWGVTTNSGTQANSTSFIRYYGLDALTESGTLDSVHIRYYIASGTEYVRVALYEGVTAGTVSGATLVVDLGQVLLDVAGLNTWKQIDASSQSLTSGKEYWIAIKGTTSVAVYQHYFTSETGQSLHECFYASNESTDETDAYDATVTNPTNNLQRSHCGYITYTPQSVPPGQIVTVYQNDLV